MKSKKKASKNKAKSKTKQKQKIKLQMPVTIEASRELLVSDGGLVNPHAGSLAQDLWEEELPSKSLGTKISDFFKKFLRRN